MGSIKVEELKKEFLREERVVEVPLSLKQKIADELLLRLRAVNASGNSTVQRGEYMLFLSFSTTSILIFSTVQVLGAAYSVLHRW